MSLSPGTSIGPYQISGVLGAGGMGEVYRARDSRLKRDVAIKVLPASFADDPNRVIRLQREAEILASLNHPNIAQIYGLEEAGATSALVMELVEGPTLADRLAHGPIPLDEALPIAKQIAEALEAAHEQGVIHRDLKPANIKVRADGTVKVLDFGLAKAMETTTEGMPSGSHSPTITTPAMTRIGMILGTAAYMSPEQARGARVEKRADVWAFGVILYEMLSGRRLFDEATVPETLAAVLKSELKLDALPGETPVAVTRLIGRCLTRDWRRRLRDIGEARITIEDVLAHPDATPHAHAPALARQPLWRRTLPWAITVLALIAAALTMWAPWRVAPARAGLIRLGTRFRCRYPDALGRHGSPRAVTERPAARPRRDVPRGRPESALRATAQSAGGITAPGNRGRTQSILFAGQPVDWILRRRQAEKDSRSWGRSHRVV